VAVGGGQEKGAPCPPSAWVDASEFWGAMPKGWVTSTESVTFAELTWDGEPGRLGSFLGGGPDAWVPPS